MLVRHDCHRAVLVVGVCIGYAQRLAPGIPLAFREVGMELGSHLLHHPRAERTELPGALDETGEVSPLDLPYRKIEDPAGMPGQRVISDLGVAPDFLEPLGRIQKT